LQKCHGLKRMGFIEKLRKKLSFTAKKKTPPRMKMKPLQVKL